MSPFAAVFDRHRRPLEPAALETLRRALESPGSTGFPGSPGSDNRGPGTILGGWTGFAYRRASVPEPMAPPVLAAPTDPAATAAADNPAAGACLAADGFDAGLLAGPLGLAPDARPAEVLIEGLNRCGRDLWSRLDDPFAVLLFDPARHALHLARDPLGSQALFFLETGNLVVAADRIETLLRWGSEARALDADQLVRFFGLEQPRAGRTYFRDIREVPPGSALEFTSGRSEDRFWKIRPGERTLATDAVFAERFRALLQEETAKFMADSDPVGIMLSGGIDSTSLAALAALSASESRKGSPKPLACSWVFDELASCDERSWIADTLSAGDFDVIQIPGDGCWPLVDLEAFSSLPGAPEENPLRVLKSALYSAAYERGCTVLLNGGFADIFYRGGSLYFRDLVRDGRLGSAARGLARQIQLSGWRAAAGSFGRLIRAAGRRKARRPAPQWLTASARRRWARELASSPAPERDPRDVIPYLALEARGLGIENRYAERQGVRVASPYWTRNWIEFMVSMPAYQVFRPGVTKYVAREAMRGVIPERIRVRQRPTLVDPLFDRGIFERETGAVDDLLHGGTPIWQEFVDSDFIAGVGPASPSAHKVVLWQCLSFELWRRKHGWEVA